MTMPEAMPATTTGIAKPEEHVREGKVNDAPPVMTPTLAALVASPNKLSGAAMEAMLSRGLRNMSQLEIGALAPFLTPTTIMHQGRIGHPHAGRAWASC